MTGRDRPAPAENGNRHGQPRNRSAERRITGREACRGEEAEIPLDSTADVLGKRGAVEFAMAEPGAVSRVSEGTLRKTLVSRKGGIDADALNRPGLEGAIDSGVTSRAV